MLRLRNVLRDRIKAYVAAHLRHSPLTVASVARALNCSRRHLYNAFKDEPEGIAGYVLAQRLANASQALRDAQQFDRSITEIAFETGFRTAAHFSRRFRLRYGCTPSVWRGARRCPPPVMAERRPAAIAGSTTAVPRPSALRLPPH